MEIHNQINEAISRLKQGEVIAYPTETFFGLGVDPFNPDAVEKLLKYKQRYLNEGVSLIASSSVVVDNLEIKVVNQQKRKALQRQFWPGPLTLVVGLEKVSFVNKLLAQDGSIAIRVSSSPIASKLADGIGGLITATSANPHGFTPARSTEEAKNYFPEIYVLDANLKENTPSTILNIQTEPFKVLREGMISLMELEPYL